MKTIVNIVGDLKKQEFSPSVKTIIINFNQEC